MLKTFKEFVLLLSTIQEMRLSDYTKQRENNIFFQIIYRYIIREYCTRYLQNKIQCVNSNALN